jgi:hypothetical protein
MHWSVADHAVFSWRTKTSELLLACATDDCLCLTDDRAYFVTLKTRLENVFELTLQEGDTLRFLNLRIIQSPQGISIDQTDHIVDTFISPYFKSRDVSKLLPITSPFPTDSSFENALYDSPILAGSKLHSIKKRGAPLYVAITTQVDLGYTIMRLSGYLAAPNAVIFQALDHFMRYLYFYRHLPIMYPCRPLSKKALTMHWAKGSAEYLAPEYGNVLVNSANANHARDIRDRRCVSSSLHLLNGIIVAWSCKKQNISTLHSTGSKIISLWSGVQKTIHTRDFTSSVGYPIGDPTAKFDDNQGTIKCAKASHLHDNTRHLATHIYWINEQYIMGIIKLLYTKTALQLSDCNTKPLCGRSLQATIAYIVGIRHYPDSDSKHYRDLYLVD